MKFLVLGVGNILFGDEGIGVHLANLLKVNYRFTSAHHTLDIIDGGTLAQHLIPLITSYDKVLILDCINADESEIGDVFYFDFVEIPHNVNWQGSAHEVEMLHTLKMIELLGDLPHIHIIATIPEILGEDSSFVLSGKIQDSALTMRDIALKFLKDSGFEVAQVAHKGIQEIANNSFRGY